ncbi:MAG: adenylate kinase [Lutibacter sp.]|uniref:adenylate kinase n=1 Tax=Lutibacter sp. TaxID=1925666 RepID=UPI00185A813C|nr:adenylate kinase [Lutibacter sp.]MBT8318316.1 adenylate kinase [Lutibacter sp.]NNJ59174.1 adenylate kinase [Lutibacter sp.]
MGIIKLHDKYFKAYISEKKIAKAIKQLVKQVSEDCKDEIPLFIGILNGSFMFVADFVREYNYSCEVSFVKLASYQGTNSTGKIKQLVGINENLEGRTVVILEDIIDTGNTLEEIYDIFRDKKLKQLKIATLFFKPDVFKKELPIDYIGISIPDEFIVGYGLDYNGLGRNLSSIYQITPKPTIKNILLFGPPGVGKGTQADLLKAKYNLVHVSTGDVFRSHMKRETKLGILAKSYIDKGNLVPDDVTIKMLKQVVHKLPPSNGIIFDGFPRTKAQAIALDELLEEKGETVGGMLTIDVPTSLLIARLLERGKTSGRSDDQDENKILNRFNEYYTKTEILKEYYQAQNKYFGVDGVGEISEITKRLSDVFDKL